MLSRLPTGVREISTRDGVFVHVIGIFRPGIKTGLPYIFERCFHIREFLK